MILAGDIGGTNTRLAIFDIGGGLAAPIWEHKYPSAAASSLIELVHRFIADCNLDQKHIKAAAFAVAGPVINQKIDITNLLWEIIDAQALSDALGGVPTNLMNDMVGLSNFIPVLAAEDKVVLNEGAAGMMGAMAVIAPGTGLGEAYLGWDGEHHHPSPSEGGHADFGPVDEQQLALLAYLMPKFGHVSYERVCSGIGIPNLYNYLKSTGEFSEPDWLSEAFLATDDPSPVIFNGALRDETPALICVEAVKLFCRILGAEAGNLALKSSAVSGVYVAGGIPPRIIPFLQDNFMPAFLNKGRFSSVLQNYPVFVITHPNPVLYGAARNAFSLLNSTL